MDIETRRSYSRKWYSRNKDKAHERVRRWRLKNRVRANSQAAQSMKRWRRKHPFEYYLKHRLGEVRRRCNNPHSKAYKNYGARGIKCLLTLKEFKFLWEQYGAANLDHAELHRIDPDGNYTLENCKFLPRSEHRAIKT